MTRVLLMILTTLGVAVAGDLPQLNDPPWTGWFAGVQERHFRFGVNRDGDAMLMPMKDRKETIQEGHWIRIQPVIEEVQEGGRVVSKTAQPGGWEALTEAGEEVRELGFRGTVAGGARFEVRFEVEGGAIRGGGKIIDKGELTKWPIRLALRVRIPNLYGSASDREKLKKTASRDRISLLRADGEKLRLDALEPMDAESEEFNGPGIREAQVVMEGYKGAKIELSSGDAGLFEFSNFGTGELYKGFTFGWKPDPEKDPDGAGRFVLKMR